jgi:hypothetical protein
LRRFPLGFFSAGSGLGLGLKNQEVRLSGEAGGRGQSPRKFWQSICPSRPPAFAFATTWVMTDPSASRLNCVPHAELKLKWVHSCTASSGPLAGEAIARNFATSRPAWQRAQVFVPNVGLVEIAIIWSKAALSNCDEDAVGGSGCGSVVSLVGMESGLHFCG